MKLSRYFQLSNLKISNFSFFPTALPKGPFQLHASLKVIADLQTKKLRLNFSRKCNLRVGFDMLHLATEKMVFAKRFFFVRKFSAAVFEIQKGWIHEMCNMILTNELLWKRSRENEHFRCKMGHFWTKFKLEARNDQFRKKSQISLFLFKIELKFSMGEQKKNCSTWNFCYDIHQF